MSGERTAGFERFGVAYKGWVGVGVGWVVSSVDFNEVMCGESE